MAASGANPDTAASPAQLTDGRPFRQQSIRGQTTFDLSVEIARNLTGDQITEQHHECVATVVARAMTVRVPMPGCRVGVRDVPTECRQVPDERSHR
jgi:hypothetical protein